MTDHVPPPGYEHVHPASQIGFGRSVGPVFVDRVGHRMAFRVGPEHANPAGVCHGGAMAAFADSQIAAVRDKAYDPEGHSPTISLTVDYIAPAPVGSLVEMQVTLVRRTGTMIFTQAVMMADGAAVARSNAIYRHYDKRP